MMVGAHGRAPLRGTAEHPGDVGAGLALPSSALNSCGDGKPSPYSHVVIDGLGAPKLPRNTFGLGFDAKLTVFFIAQAPASRIKP